MILVSWGCWVVTAFINIPISYSAQESILPVFVTCLFSWAFRFVTLRIKKKKWINFPCVSDGFPMPLTHWPAVTIVQLSLFLQWAGCTPRALPSRLPLPQSQLPVLSPPVVGSAVPTSSASIPVTSSVVDPGVGSISPASPKISLAPTDGKSQLDEGLWTVWSVVLDRRTFRHVSCLAQ